jgi:hypothetical protein
MRVTETDQFNTRVRGGKRNPSLGTDKVGLPADAEEVSADDRRVGNPQRARLTPGQYTVHADVTTGWGATAHATYALLAT